MEDTSSQAEQLLMSDPALENAVEPLAVSIEDILIKKETEEPEEALSLYVTIHDIKKEAPDLLGAPGYSKWDDQEAPGPSLAVKIDLCCLPVSKEIKSEPPDPAAMQEILSDGDSSFPEDDPLADDGTLARIKSEPNDDVEMKSEVQLKAEELMQDSDGIFFTDINKQKEKVKRFQCKNCSYSARYKAELRKHLVVHKGDDEIKWFQCTQCSFKTKYKVNIKQHLRHIHNENYDETNWFQCAQCSFRTKYNYNLKQHLIMHNKNDKETNWFQCTQCSFKTKYNVNLKHHLNTVHNDNDDKTTWFLCTQCSFKTKYKSSLKNHLATHENDNELSWFQCTNCNFKTKHKRSLNRHLMTHE